jgi:hypothetical protein
VTGSPAIVPPAAEVVIERARFLSCGDIVRLDVDRRD